MASASARPSARVASDSAVRRSRSAAPDRRVVSACASASAISRAFSAAACLLDRVALGVRRLAHLGVELALLQLGAAGGDVLLRGEHVLILRRLGQRAGRGRVGGRCVGLGLDLGLLEGELAIGDGDVLLGTDAGLLGLAAGDRLGDGGLLLGPGGLGAAEVGQVVALGLDVLELERVEDQALAGQAVLGLLGDGGGEGGPVADDLLDASAGRRWPAASRPAPPW